MNDARDGEDAVRVDVVGYPSGTVKAVPAGKGTDVVRSQNRGRGGSLVRDPVVLVAGAVAAVGAGTLAVAVLAASVLLLGTVVPGLLAALVVVAIAALAVACVVLLRSGGGDAELLDEAVTLWGAREQWNATPVSEVARTSPGDAARERAREHASEGGAGR